MIIFCLCPTNPQCLTRGLACLYSLSMGALTVRHSLLSTLRSFRSRFGSHIPSGSWATRSTRCRSVCCRRTTPRRRGDDLDRCDRIGAGPLWSKRGAKNGHEPPPSGPVKKIIPEKLTFKWSLKGHGRPVILRTPQLHSLEGPKNGLL